MVAAIKLLTVFVIIFGLMGAALWILRARVVIVAEFIAFLLERKLWWITPIVVFLLLIGVLVVLTQTSGIGATIIYPFF
ncbi:MAG: DUF5989 family protein [Candidatus Sumerlaeota bacterium]|nr:DUF5989 family protein [Candidatus Sumerlaeota bacterium]